MVSVAAIVAAGIPYLWVLWALLSDRVNPFRTNGSNLVSAYDIQARAIMHGHLWIPPGSISTEAFVHGGRQYTYFGVLPSLLRIPVLLFTHSLDGRMTAISMLGAWLVTALFSALLLWRIRIVIRGDAPLAWAEAASYGVLLVSVLVGSVLLFLASQPDVFSEDLAWSVALTCASLFALVGVVERPSWGRVITCGLLVLLTNLNRATTGDACVLAMALIASWFALGRAGQQRRQWALPLFVASLVALVAGCAIDLAKFDILFGFPPSEQLLFKTFSFSHLNGGNYFGIRYAPSALQAYVDPTNLRLTTLFPFFTLPDVPSHPIAHTALFNRSPTAAVIPSMPFLCAIGLWGVITTFAPRQPTVVRGLRILLVAMVAAAGTVMIFGWILERYVADFMPLLVLASMVGMVDIWKRLPGTRTPRVVVAGVIGLLALFGLATNLGIAMTPSLYWTSSQAVRYVQVQRALSDVTGHPLSHDVVKASGFPDATMGQLFVQGNCDALYIALGDVPAKFYFYNLIWLPVERAPHTPLCRSLVSTAKTSALHTRIALPTSGQTVSGSGVELAAVAYTGIRVASVSFTLTGGSLSAPVTVGHGTGHSSLWLYRWNSRSVPNATYVLTSVATDSTGHTIESPGVSVTVRNSPNGDR